MLNPGFKMLFYLLRLDGCLKSKILIDEPHPLNQLDLEGECVEDLSL